MLTMPREDAGQRIDDRLVKGKELRDRRLLVPEELKRTEQEYWTWSEYNEEMLRQMFTSPKLAEEYSSSLGVFFAGERTFADEVQDLARDIDTKSRRLQSIRERLQLIPLAPAVAPTHRPLDSSIPQTPTVFVVHGHDDAVRETVARFLAKLQLHPVILHEQPSQGRTIMEKLEAHSDVGFAVVLLTPDDVGGQEAGSLRPRARQNVLLELGYFIGRLGRSHVCAMYKDDIELPTDYLGVVYIRYDPAGGWRLELARELKAAGFAIDMNNAV